MANSTRILDYIAYGTFADLPVSAPVGSGCLALYYATDTNTLYGWTGSAWVALTIGASAWTATSVAHVGTGLTVTSGTLEPNYQAGTLTTFNTGLTLTSGTLTPNYEAGTLTTFNTGLTLASGTLTPNWQQSLVTALGSGISISGGTLTATGSGGSVTSVTAGAGLSGGPITTTGTLTANYQAGTLTTVGTGLSLTSGTLTATGPTAAGIGAVINSGTVEIDNNVTLTGTNGATTTIAPGSGTSWVVLDMPATAGTVTLAAGPTFKGQKAMLDIVYGATLSTPSLNSGFILTGGVSSFTPGTTVNTIDRLELFSPDATHWVVLALSQGGTL
jgi:hypothetical protein